MKKLAIFTVLALFLVPSTAHATDVATVDLEQIMKNAKVMNYIETELKAKKAEFQEEVSAQEETLADKNAELETKSAIMSKDALMEEYKNFQQQVVEFKIDTQKKEELLQSAYLDAVGKVNYEIKRIIRNMEKEDEYTFDVVIPENQTLYVKDSTDITAEVISRLNKSMKKVEIKI